MKVGEMISELLSKVDTDDLESEVLSIGTWSGTDRPCDYTIKIRSGNEIKEINIGEKKTETVNEDAEEVKAIPIDQLLSILPKYDDYIHTKTYPYNETMEDIYSKGYEEGWNVCLKHIKEELDYWEKENER